MLHFGQGLGSVALTLPVSELRLIIPLKQSKQDPFIIKIGIWKRNWLNIRLSSEKSVLVPKIEPTALFFSLIKTKRTTFRPKFEPRKKGDRIWKIYTVKSPFCWIRRRPTDMKWDYVTNVLETIFYEWRGARDPCRNPEWFLKTLFSWSFPFFWIELDFLRESFLGGTWPTSVFLWLGISNSTGKKVIDVEKSKNVNFWKFRVVEHWSVFRACICNGT